MNTVESLKQRIPAVLERHIGKDKGLSITGLASQLPDLVSGAPGERMVRHAIEELRREGHPICAHPSTGYHLPATPDELDATCSFLYERAMTSLTQIAAMKRVAVPDLRGQLGLPAVPNHPALIPVKP